jgi:hypothetical protein
MKVEAVTVCIGYADFLAEIAPHNIPVLDRWLIVTSDSDEETRDLCRRLSLPTLLTEDARRNDEPFNKGRVIERGLQHLSNDGWRLHLDADIALPSRTRLQLEAADLDPKCIYGTDRVMVRNYDDWKRLKSSGWLAHDSQCLVTPPKGFDIGTRWVHHEMGYVPIGFFQLWHSTADQWKGARTRPYPTKHNDACRTDVQHALQWDRRNRELLAELLVVHLESESCANGTNWKGRKTKRFGPMPSYQRNAMGADGC